MRAEEEKLKNNYAVDYSQILPIFIYPTEEQSQNLFPQMDKVIEKCSEVIERHSMYIRKKEHIKWIDDSYFLIGKARFYKREYGLAEETFLYVYQAYKREDDRYRGLNWLIRTYIETEQWGKAEEFIDLAEDEMKRYPDDHKAEYYAILADYLIKRDKDYEKAIEPLTQAMEMSDERETKRWYAFILGQIQQGRRDFQAATTWYTQVIKLKPDYTMRFNAKINRAIALDITAGNSDDIKKELRKMLKDGKNEEFRDQIYYALAEIALKEDNEPQAIEYLRKSAAASTTNTKQKALSYLKLADIYFEQPDYLNAQTYYDSTLKFLPEEHPLYYDAELKNESLQELVKNLKVIKLQDSLLQLSNLSEKDREKKIKKMIADMQAEEERRKQAEMRALEEQQQEANLQANFGQNFGGNRKGNWYFYNPTTMALGQNEFKQIWGDRELRNHWRRNPEASIKNQVNNQQDTTALAKAEEVDAAEKYNPESYLDDIPADNQARLEAHGKIAEALFNVGTIFKESFDDMKSAVAAFRRITVEYDTSRFNLPAHYQLYRIYSQEQMTAEAEKEKQWILDNHPFSEYAYLIKNPEYAKQSKETREKVEEFYEATYKLYTYGLYNDVIASARKADETFAKNHLKPQFDYLRAKAIGKSATQEEFKTALEKVVADHPESNVKEEAQLILNYMKRGNPSPPTENSPEIYNNNPKENHLFILSLAAGSKNTELIKNQLSNFNSEFFRQKQLDLTTSNLENRILLMVRTFKNLDEAKLYLQALRNNPQLMSLIGSEDARQYIISTSNFRTLFKSKDEEEYITFYKRQINI